mmetsp:Transcript_22590/g.35340  ORF Transcript_22590/g.35340 Transcript_22590/m.35340 type:complete len:189 (-) Transcript_22590:1061-1627(-)
MTTTVKALDVAIDILKAVRKGREKANKGPENANQGLENAIEELKRAERKEPTARVMLEQALSMSGGPSATEQILLDRDPKVQEPFDKDIFEGSIYKGLLKQIRSNCLGMMKSSMVILWCLSRRPKQCLSSMKRPEVSRSDQSNALVARAKVDSTLVRKRIMWLDECTAGRLFDLDSSTDSPKLVHMSY